MEDPIIQRPFVPEQTPSSEELQKRQQMRIEQGQKLKELMAKKREDKLKVMQRELDDLQQVEQSKISSALDQQGFKDELSHRGFQSADDFFKRINHLMLKLNI